MGNFSSLFLKAFHAYKISRTIHLWHNSKKRNNHQVFDVFIDENFTWKPHVNTISTKISKSIGILYRARLIIPGKQLN